MIYPELLNFFIYFKIQQCLNTSYHSQMVYNYHHFKIVKLNNNLTMKTFGGEQTVICIYNKNLSAVSQFLDSIFFALHSSVDFNRQMILKNNLEERK